MPTRSDSYPAERRMRWSSLPEETAWMLENDKGRPIAEVIEDFERAFGIRLNRLQVTAFRSRHGTQSRRGRNGGKPRKPVGYERESKGYVIVKVAPETNVPQSKDNWKLKHVHVWEQHNGPLPEGWTVLFADRNTRNFDPGNLVAIPRTYIAQLNYGYDWCDRETLEAAIACVKLKHAIVDAENRPRPCGVCGREFVPPANLRWSKVNTCPTCRAQGKKSYTMHGSAGEAECAVCGRTFAKDKPHQRRCRECISEAPKHSAEKHISKKRTAQKKGEAI